MPSITPTSASTLVAAYIFDGAGSTITGQYNGYRNVQIGTKFVF